MNRVKTNFLQNFIALGFDRWNVWCQQSVNRRILGAIITVGGLTFLAKLAIAANELVVANQFGVSDALDAFLIAFLLPSFLINVVAGSFNPAFMPTFIQVRAQQGPQGAQRLFSSVMLWSAALLFTVSILLALTAPYVLPILGSGFSPEKLMLTRSLFFVLLPILIIRGLTTIWGAALNADERFALAAVAPITTPIVTVAVLLTMGKVWGIYALALGTVGGFLLEALVMALGLKRQKISIIPRWHGMDPATRQIMNQYAPMIAGSFLMSSTTLVDQSMAAMLGPGSVSALRYGYMTVAFILGTGTAALGTAVLPYFSRMIAMEDWSGVRHTLKTYARLILLSTVPLTFIFVVFSEPLVGLLFQRGAFTAADTRLVGRIQAFYFLQVPFYFLGILIVRLISSLKANHVLMRAAFMNLLVNIIFNYAFMRWLGVAGIALSTSVVYLISFCYLLYMVLRLTREADCKHV